MLRAVLENPKGHGILALVCAGNVQNFFMQLKELLKGGKIVLEQAVKLANMAGVGIDPSQMDELKAAATTPAA
jgi:hypothetical protein